MRLQSHSILKRIILLSLVLFAFSAVPRSSDRILVKIDKNQRVNIDESVVQDVTVIQELDSCWIAEVSSEQYATLQQVGATCEILDPLPAAKVYYLLLAASDQIHAIEPLGHLTVIEDQACLFWTEGEDFWDLLPAQIQVKRLPERTAQRITFATEKQEPVVRLQEETLPNAKVLQMVGEVAKSNLSAYIQDLQNFQTRRAATTSLEAAGTYVYDFFRARGISAEYDPFTFSYQGITYATRNIVGSIQGKTVPEQIVIIGAHYDSTSDQPFTLAPGADDNASGSAAVMEIARIMSNYSFDYTVRFICFSAEELGLLGSRHYTQEDARKGETILGMIDLDMIGYAAKVNEDLDLIANNPSEWLANLFVSCTGTYTTVSVLKAIRPAAAGSDHSSFWDQGYSAVMGIEAYPLVNPYYHRTTDTLATLNMDFAASVTQAALATAATLARPVSTPLSPTNVAAHSVIVRSLFSRFKTVLLSWKSTDPTVIGFNLYRSTTPYVNFQRINSAPVKTSDYTDRFLEPNRSYYYVVTAVDGQGRESNYSNEVRDDQKN